MKEPWSQFSRLGQSHNELILESSLVFMPWMLGFILCGATTGLSTQLQCPPQEAPGPSEGFSNANNASVGGPAVQPGVRELAQSPHPL